MALDCALISSFVTGLLDLLNQVRLDLLANGAEERGGNLHTLEL